MGACNILEEPGAAILDCTSQLVVCDGGEIELAGGRLRLTALETEGMFWVVYGVEVHEIRE